MNKRPRRLRGDAIIRQMVRETRIHKNSLMYPLFVKEGISTKEAIETMPGQYRYSLSELSAVMEELLSLGIDKVLLFGIPEVKDPYGKGAYAEDGIIQKALQLIGNEYPEIYKVTDVCMCEYTSHGHCGILKGESVDNDATLTYLGRIALSHVEAGADMIAPSDMMDGRIGYLRKVLDEEGYEEIPIMAYSAKYASAFYGPFREAAGSAPQFGDRKSYQMDYHNRREALKEVLLDVEEGADIVMVKPALSYLDIIREVKDGVNVPVAAYSVSGEYSMVKGAAGAIDEAQIICEMAVSAYRAGADIYITYFAKELAQFMDEGRIG